MKKRLYGRLPMEKREKWRWCTVERLSACHHLVTGESEGHEEPLGSDGTTRHSREACFRVPFTCPRIERPGTSFRKASTSVQECPGLSRRLLKCARRLPVVLPIGVGGPKWGANRYIPTTFLLRGPPPSSTSRLLFCTGVRPDYFSAQGSVPFGYVPTTFLLRVCAPCILQTLRVRPDYFPAQRSVPFGYVPTTFLLRGHPLRGSVPFGYVPTSFLLRGHPLRVRPDYFSAQGSVPFGYVPTTFLLRGSFPSGPSRL
ncbi:hypothetical protein CRG98_006404 [Punica granatum]|uniref:Uncharacterized protein n=1 Tax=Punica granatum TaxID=22663 RepID=A0A2I0KZB7_PUNGR|nr:hypothetical protein CRG98_006404 [Punica granatum]